MNPTMRWRPILMLGVATALGGPGSAVAGDVAPLAASFDYAVPARFQTQPLPAQDVPSAGATFYFSGPVRPEFWRVDLDACASSGAIASYEWTLDGVPRSTSASCDGAFFEVEEEGAHQVTLRIHDAAGGIATASRRVVVQDWLLVGLGDSYGSGEGVPDVPVSALALEAVQAAQDALAAAAQAFAESLASYALAEQDLDALLPLLNTAIARVNALFAAAQAVADACDLPPTPLLCAQANAAYLDAGVQLAAALVPLGLEALFGEPTLLGVLANWRTSLLNARDAALAVLNAAGEARDAALLRLDQAWAQIGPRWQGRQCHRSASSGQVQAARRLEEADPHTSVTFLHLACSGAKVWQGLLEGYPGQEKLDSEMNLAPQLDAAAGLIAGRELDGLVVSIGGNDVKFADVILACLGTEPCFDEPSLEDPAVQAYFDDYCAPLGVLASLCESYFENVYGSNIGNANRLFLDGAEPPDPEGRLGLDDLPAAYAALQTRLEDLAVDGELEGLFEARGGVRLYLTAYPSITRREPTTPGAAPEPCGFDPSAPLEERLRNFPGVTLGEMLWAEGFVAPALAASMASSAAAHRWRFVDEHVAGFDGHGYCAVDNWLVRIPQSIRAQIRPSFGAIGDVLANAANGSVHPNASGHEAYASAIFGALVCDFYPGCDPAAEPRAPRLASRSLPGTKLVIKDHAAKAAKRKIALVARTALVEAPVPGDQDPTRLGGALRVANPRSGGDDALFLLPAAGWKGLGKPAGAKGWRYRDPRRASGPCASVLVLAGKSVIAKCEGASIPFTLDEDAQDSIGVSLTVGGAGTQCLSFGGEVEKDEPAAGGKLGVFRATNAPAPASCPLP